MSTLVTYPLIWRVEKIPFTHVYRTSQVWCSNCAPTVEISEFIDLSLLNQMPGLILNTCMCQGFIPARTYSTCFPAYFQTLTVWIKFLWRPTHTVQRVRNRFLHQPLCRFFFFSYRTAFHHGSVVFYLRIYILVGCTISKTSAAGYIDLDMKWLPGWIPSH